MADCPPDKRITVSVVSHGHDLPVADLITQLLAQPVVTRLVLTLNVPQRLDLPTDERLLVISNDSPRGFGQNHNQAFAHVLGEYFLVLNPDVGLTPALLSLLLDCQQAAGAAVVAPAVFASNGTRQDSWRQFPTLRGLFAKALGHDTSQVTPETDSHLTYPDWVAGMCMLFDAKAYRQLGGFDERYYLYYEDVDICARTWLRGMTVAGCNRARLVHDGQRASHRNWQHLRWHVASMLRYLWQYRSTSQVITKPNGVASKNNHDSQN